MLRRVAAAALLLLACASDTPGAGGDPPLPGVALPDPVLAARLAAADAVRGGGPHRYTNRLALETSPYLLQHAHNPVSWWAWSDEAFARARAEHKLVLVSVGYSTCHWCHVMEAESFDDPEVAAYLNASFICIKVDREERPDVDAMYMRALQAMRNSGGWPMNMVVDAERRPVFGATYMSKPQLLGVMKSLRETDPARLEQAATELVAALDRASAPPADVPGAEAIERGAKNLARAFDAEAGGFGRGTKFPSPPDLELLLRYHRRTNDADALAMVTYTLERIAAGGIHDQIGGGFHRYATDRAWLVPHFEKMLYDNAQLAVVYLEAAQITGDAHFAAISRETLDYLAREMQSPTGAFYSATDADSRGSDGMLHEGAFFTWTEDELAAVLGGDAPAAGAYWGVGGTAAVDGRSVLHAAGHEPPAELGAWRAKLYAARARRTPPARDDKRLTSWNALAISAFARAGFAFADEGYVRTAVRAADDILAHRRAADGSLLRSDNQPAMLDDVARLACALLDLFEATWDPRWLTAAVDLAHQMDRFVAPDGGYFGSTQPLLVRDKPTDDGVEPSGNASAIAAFLRLAELTGDDAWRARADRAFSAFASLLAADTRTPALRGDLDRALDTPLEIVIVAPHALSEAEPLLAEVRGAYLPDRTLVAATSAQLPALAKLTPLLDGKTALAGAPTAFVCERTACKQPTSDPAVLASQLARVKPLFPDRSPEPLRPASVGGTR